MRTMFLSFAGLAIALRKNEFDTSEFNDGLFCFKATRQYVMSGEKSNAGYTALEQFEHFLTLKVESQRDPTIHAKVKFIFEMLQGELFVAEMPSQGRVYWRESKMFFAEEYWKGIERLLRVHVSKLIQIPDDLCCDESFLRKTLSPFVKVII